MDELYLASCIVGLALINFALRNTSFILPSKFIKHPITKDLARFIPAIIMTLLVLSCLKESSVDQLHTFASFAGVLVTAAIHILKRNALLSIAAGTSLYILLIN